jgi:glutamine amidotransferase
VVPLPNRSTNGDIQKIPEIGWNVLRPSGAVNFNGTILNGFKPEQSVYFVHSFMAKTMVANHCLADYDFGGHSVAAVIQKDLIHGCQFHPEKSGDVGLSILRSFLST